MERKPCLALNYMQLEQVVQHGSRNVICPEKGQSVNIAISVQNVSKKFTLHHERSRSFQELALGLFQRGNGTREEFWALRDVSFEIAPGETVGLIGPNGAGKSTVLKLISRIIVPTSGQIEVNGRLGALLELGTGFHPDLTGRENIYLYGSILGLNRAKIRQRLHDIIAFAELERFIDTPVKHYSSGMYVRLGFSVAVHIEPEILLVDEVLAVGDYSFQAKCVQKINEMQHKGVTIVFVSHALNMVQDICDRALWLHDGKMILEGHSSKVVGKYLEGFISGKDGAPSTQTGFELGKRWGSREAEITGVHFYDAHGNEQDVFETGGSFAARIQYEAHKKIENPRIGVAIHRLDGTHVNGPNTDSSNYPIGVIEGKGAIDYIIDSLPLLPGTYLFSAAIYDHTGMYPFDHHDRTYLFRVRQGPIKERLGLVYIPCQWEHRRS
jgi:ABC-type polysaccharide/polyol phosphate transport system ATPase subunit